MASDELFINGLRGHRGYGRPWPRIAEQVEAPGGDIGNSRCELEPQQMAERENMVGNAAAIGMVAFNRKFGTMMQQAVKDVGCL